MIKPTIAKMMKTILSISHLKLVITYLMTASIAGPPVKAKVSKFNFDSSSSFYKIILAASECRMCIMAA